MEDKYWDDKELYEQYNILLDFDYKDKIVLDIGAEIGTSAKFFISRGAKFVWCIEGDPNAAAKCQSNIEQYFPGKAQAVSQWVTSPYSFEQLLSSYGASSQGIKSDIIKIDIEGWECCLLDVKDRIIAEQKEWIIDYHSDLLADLLREKLGKNGFKLLPDVKGAVIHAVKNT